MKLLRCCSWSLLLLAPAAYAVDNIVCVTTAADLVSELAKASDSGVNVGKDNVLHLAAGTYLAGPATDTAAAGFSYYSNSSTGGLVIEGGWNSDCTAHTNDASLTILDGSSLYPLLHLASVGKYERVRWMTIQNGKSANGAAIMFTATNPFVEFTGEEEITDTIIRNNTSTDKGGAIWILNYGPSPLIYIENNVIAGNHADGTAGAAYIWSGGVPVELINNTVANNTTGAVDGVGGIFVHTDTSNSGSDILSIIDNIFWGNGLYSLNLDSAHAYLDYNDLDTKTGSAAFETSGATNVDPMFVNGTSDFHLGTGSPLFHVSPSGDRSALDPDGVGYPQNGNADIGAYSDTIFADGVDEDHTT